MKGGVCTGVAEKHACVVESAFRSTWLKIVLNLVSTTVCLFRPLLDKYTTYEGDVTYLREVEFPPVDVEVREVQVRLLELLRALQRVGHLGDSLQGVSSLEHGQWQIVVKFHGRRP